jgi:hypothetical protein
MFCLYDRVPGTDHIQTGKIDSHPAEDVPAGALWQWETCLCCTGADIINDLNRQAGTAISLKDRKAAPALGSRFLRSYVPLRCVPNESGSARDMAVPAYVGHIFLIYLYDKDRFAGKTLDLF